MTAWSAPSPPPSSALLTRLRWLQSRLALNPDRLKQPFERGDIGQSEYRARNHEAMAEIELLPFDAVASVVETLRTAIDRGSPEQLRELIGMLIERIKVTEDGGYGIEPVPAARPFFAAAESLVPAPPDGSWETGSHGDPLAWYAI